MRSIDDIGIPNGVLDIIMDEDSFLLIQEAWQQCLRTGQMNLHSHLPHAVDIRTGYPAVQDIAQNCHLAAGEMPLVLLNGKEDRAKPAKDVHALRHRH